jgi:inner membrane protein
MASVFGHIAASTAIGLAFFPRLARPMPLFLAGFCAFAPDLDVLSFHFGVPYSSPWGHRGWTHSLFFSLVFGALIGLVAGQLWRHTGPEKRGLALWFALSTLSHPLLDMCTNGGLGCALWWPYDASRVFFPFSPILVSPLGASAFFSAWGAKVLWSELLWIGLPGILLVLFTRNLRSNSKC